MKKILIPTITALFFSGSYIAGKYTTYDLSPITTSFIRYFIALFFLTILIFYFKTSILKIEKKDFFRIFLLGLFGIIGYHYFFFLSLRFTYIANTGVINAFTPILTGLTAAIFLSERLTKKNYWGIFLGFVGVLTIITKGKVETISMMNFNFGDILMLTATLCWVVYSLVIKSLSNKHHPFTLTFYSTIIGVILLFLLSLAENGLYQISNISKASLFSVTYMGIFASGIGYLLYNLSIKLIGPTKTSSLVYSIVPIFVSILAFIFFQESITFILIISILLIIIGLNFVMRRVGYKEKVIL